MSRATQDTATAGKASRKGLSPAAADLSRTFRSPSRVRQRGPTTPREPRPPRFGLVPVRSPLLGESLLFSFPQGTKMFQFPWLASTSKMTWMAGLCPPGCPIRKPRGQGPFAPNPGLSQLTASFIASESQGIRRAPFNASYAWVSTSHKGGESRIPQLFHLSSGSESIIVIRTLGFCLCFRFIAKT